MKFTQRKSWVPFRTEHVDCYEDAPPWIDDDGEEYLEYAVPVRKRIQGTNLVSVSVADVWLEERIGGEWMVAYRLSGQQGQTVVSEVRIFPYEDAKRRVPGRWSGEVLGSYASAPKGGITSRLLREIRVGKHLLYGEKFIRWFYKKLGAEEASDTKMGIIGLPWRPKKKTRSKRGRPTQPDEFFVEIAKSYSDLVTAGSRAPIKELASALRQPVTTVRSSIHTARERGFLSPGSGRGRLGGQLTPTAREILKKALRRKK